MGVGKNATVAAGGGDITPGEHLRGIRQVHGRAGVSEDHRQLILDEARQFVVEAEAASLFTESLTFEAKKKPAKTNVVDAVADIQRIRERRPIVA